MILEKNIIKFEPKFKPIKFLVIQQHDHVFFYINLYNKTSNGVRAFFNTKRANTKIIQNNLF